jgi:hypothetical protein
MGWCAALLVLAALAGTDAAMAQSLDAISGDDADVMATPDDTAINRTASDDLASEPDDNAAAVNIDDATLESVLSADAALLPGTGRTTPLRLPGGAGANSRFNWNKTDNADGSAKYSVNKPLAAPWDAKIGADISVAPSASDIGPIRQWPASVPSAGAGSAWANVAVPNFATVELRAEPANDRDRVATRLERSLPLGRSLSVTMQASLGVTEMVRTSSSAPPTTIACLTPPQSRVFDADKSLSLNILTTGTTLSAGSSANSGDPVMHNRLSAVQKIYGPLSVTGSFNDIGQATANKSITAGLNFGW